MGNTLNSRKNGKISSSYSENTLYCSDVYNFPQKLDNFVQIVKITGQARWRKVVPVGKLSLAERLQGTGRVILLLG